MTAGAQPASHRNAPAMASDAADPISARWPNFRELGGIATAQGRRVRPGRFWRGPVLTGMNLREAERLEAIDPGLIVDFRSAAEVEEIPFHMPGGLSARRLHLEIAPSVDHRFRRLFEQAHPAHDDVAEVMTDTYRDFVRRYAEVYASFLAAVAEAGERPVIFHCTAGKDRTGFAAALILAALGAPQELVERDYMISGELWRPDEILAARLPLSARAAVFGVHPVYIRAALDELEAAHGGATAFAGEAMGGEATLRDWARASTE